MRLKDEHKRFWAITQNPRQLSTWTRGSFSQGTNRRIIRLHNETNQSRIPLDMSRWTAIKESKFNKQTPERGTVILNWIRNESHDPAAVPYGRCLNEWVIGIDAFAMAWHVWHHLRKPSPGESSTSDDRAIMSKANGTISTGVASPPYECDDIITNGRSVFFEPLTELGLGLGLRKQLGLGL